MKLLYNELGLRMFTCIHRPTTYYLSNFKKSQRFCVICNFEKSSKNVQ